MLGLPGKIILYDTEYTSWEGAQARKWSGPNEYKEIVEIGAVLVETEKFSELGEFLVHVKPVKNPVLSKYFMDLTGISQEIVDREGIDYPAAIRRFAEWCGGYDAYSYGYDYAVLEENAGLLKIPFSLDAKHFFNIKDVFKKFGIPADDYISSTIVRAFGIEPVRRGHDAANDARTIVDGLRALSERTQK